MRPSPPTEVGPGLPSPCVARGGYNAWLWSPNSPDIGLGKTPLGSLNEWSPLKATFTAPRWSSTRNLEARSRVPGSVLGTFWPECDFWGQGGSWLFHIIPSRSLGPQEPEETDGSGRRIRSQVAYVNRMEQRLSLCVDLSLRCQGKTLRSNQA